MISKESLAKRSIGMFDSGFGGLTVMRALCARLPNERITYFGDTARVPYGQKSPETIVRYSIENAIFLMEQEIKILVVACNTASACAIDRLRRIFNIPVVGVITPGAKQAAETSRSGKIAVLATTSTIATGAYQKEIARIRPDAEIVSVSCPLLVPLVEEGYQSHPATKIFLKEYLNDALATGVDTLLLGCTHYPLLTDAIRSLVGADIAIVDSATTCAAYVEQILQQYELKNANTPMPEHRFFVSDDPKKFSHLGRHFLGTELVVESIPCR